MPRTPIKKNKRVRRKLLMEHIAKRVERHIKANADWVRALARWEGHVYGEPSHHLPGVISIAAMISTSVLESKLEVKLLPTVVAVVKMAFKHPSFRCNSLLDLVGGDRVVADADAFALRIKVLGERMREGKD